MTFMPRTRVCARAAALMTRSLTDTLRGRVELISVRSARSRSMEQGARREGDGPADGTGGWRVEVRSRLLAPGQACRHCTPDARVRHRVVRRGRARLVDVGSRCCSRWALL